MIPRLVDTHCHLHFPPFDTNRQDVLARMKTDQVWTVTIGTSANTSRSAIECAEANDGVWASVGYHPEHLTSSFRDPSEGEVGDFDIEEIAKIARSSKKVVAIGETGLDFYRIDKERDRKDAERIQEDAFRAHIRLACSLDLPVVIHCREALTRLAEVMKDEQSNGEVRGVVHCYTGTWEEAQPLLELGLYLSFTGIVTFPPKKSDDSAQHVHRVIEQMPLDRMLIETDAPWLAPVPHRGKENEPSFVRFVADQIAILRNTTFDEIAVTTTRNAIDFFKLR